MTHYDKLQDLAPRVGQEIGVSDWVTVDQKRIDLFAQATGDHQWIHVDPVRAAKGPYGGTVAHGFIVFAQRTVPVGTIGIIQVAQPALAVGWAYLLLDQELRPIQVLGMVLVLAGLLTVVLVSRRTNAADPVAAAVAAAESDR